MQQGIEFPFTDDQNEEDYDIDDDPYGVFAHLAGPNWHIPPTHTTAYHLWKSEVNRALSRFESDSFKILDILDAQNDTDPESFKVNGTVRITIAYFFSFFSFFLLFCCKRFLSFRISLFCTLYFLFHNIIIYFAVPCAIQTLAHSEQLH